MALNLKPAAWGGVASRESGPVGFVKVARTDPTYGTMFNQGTGTLVMGHWLLTAAHVVTETKRDAGTLQYATVTLGDVSREKHPWSTNALDNRIMYHDLYEEDYDGSLRNDLAMIPLDPAISKGVQSAKIGPLPQVGEEVIFKGWGARKTDERGIPTDFPDALHEGRLIVSESHPAILMLKSQDGGDQSRVVSVMDGDSGGPIFNLKGELVGVISHRAQRPHELKGPQVGAQSGAIPLESYMGWIEGVAAAWDAGNIA